MRYPHDIVQRGNWRLSAVHEDRGPYAITDRMFIHAEWKTPKVRHVPHPEDADEDSQYIMSYSRKKTWIPTFNRARAALDLLDENEGLKPAKAKKVVDWVADRLGINASVDDIVRWAETKLK